MTFAVLLGTLLLPGDADCEESDCIIDLLSVPGTASLVTIVASLRSQNQKSRRKVLRKRPIYAQKWERKTTMKHRRIFFSASRIGNFGSEACLFYPRIDACAAVLSFFRLLRQMPELQPRCARLIGKLVFKLSPRSPGRPDEKFVDGH